MKNYVLVLVTILFLVSCNSKEKFQGRWTNYFPSNYGLNETRSIVVSSDSLEFNFLYFDHYNKFPLIIENNTFLFNNLNLKASIKKDTLVLNDSINFVRDDLDTLYDHKPILKINLPKIKDIRTLESYNDDYTIFIYYGKRLDNKEYSLQLNDRYAEIKDLNSFLFARRHSRRELTPFFSNYLFADRDSKMKEVEKIFIEMSKVNSQILRFVNNIDLKLNDSLGLYYDYQTVLKRISPFLPHTNYKYSPNEKLADKPPLHPYLNSINSENIEPKFIYLKKDKLYYNNKIITTSKLKTIIKPWIENNKAILSLYDLESTYVKFLEMNAIINSVYKEVRNNTSLEKFKLPLKNLTREQTAEIKMQIRMYHVWSFSIPHFNHVVKENGSFFRLEVDSMPSKE